MSKAKSGSGGKGNGSGGKRNGSGRKPLPVKKKSLFVYVEETHIENVGGDKQAKAIAEQAIIKRSKNSLK